MLDSMLLLMQQMRTESANGLERHAHELAMQERLTVYDASYLAVAVKSNLVLVTDGFELEKAARKYVKTVKTGDL